MSQVTGFTNHEDIPLSLAVFLATDHYDHEQAGISATSLLKPTRQLILGGRVPAQDRVEDVSGRIASAIGTAIHDGIERAWMSPNLTSTLQALGYSERIANRIRVNPTREEVAQNKKIIPVFMEQRLFRKFKGVVISGKFDMVAQGHLEDFKSTSTFAWLNGTKDEDYILQGSIYRWLDDTIITDDEMSISFIFKDWMAAQARANPNYPKSAMIRKQFPLLSKEKTEAYVAKKLDEIERYKDEAEENLPLCSDKELWRSAPKYKYFKNPATAEKGGRSTKNFDNIQDANARMAADNNVGRVVTVPGSVRACKYCPAFDICTQKDALIADGSLVL